MSTQNFVDVDTAKLTNDIISAIEQKTGEVMYAGDERRIFAEAVAYVIGVYLSKINEQCKARLLKYAQAYTLDALGERYQCTRMAPMPATVQLKFSLATARPHDITIPQGTTVTADNNVLFATDAVAVIPAGSLTAEGVHATATVAGIIGNGVPAGAIQSFVDTVPFVTGVVNTTESSGATAGEPYPIEVDAENGDDGTGDNNYRERIKLAPAALSAAGSEPAYEYRARSASSAVEAVSIVSDQKAGTVNIYVTEQGGADPSEGTLEAVRAAVNDKATRTMNDLITVSAPEAVPYDIVLTYYVDQADESSSVEAIEGAGGVIDQYIAWQNAMLGRDIQPQRLIAMMLDSCRWVDITSPTRQVLNDSQIARFSGKLTISHAIEEE